MALPDRQQTPTKDTLEEGVNMQILRRLSIDDREYSLRVHRCDQCNLPHYRIHRFCGASYSCYRMDDSFSEDDFDTFVEQIDEMLLQSAPDLIDDFHQRLSVKNCKHGIEADGSFAFRLLEYGRHRLSLLRKLGFLDTLIERKDPKSSQAKAVRAAFELGLATAEHRLMDIYEEYLWDGFAISEWRQTGLPLAREERLRQGRVTHSAVVSAAKSLYESDDRLRRNDSETARRIVALRLPELQKGERTSVGVDAITKHLRTARDHKEL